LISKLLSWLYTSKYERLVKSTLAPWYAAQNSNFDKFNGDPVAAINAVFSAAVSSPAALPVIIATDGNDGVRVLAMTKAGFESRRECEAVMIAALTDHSEMIRRTAAAMLSRLDTIRGLAAVVAGNRYGHSVRTRAAHRLREHGASATEAIPSLFAAICDPTIGFRGQLAATYALAAIGKDALPYLIHALQHGSTCLQNEAAVALRENGMGGDHTARINEILKDYDAELKNDEADS
jgi:HEAT repeat protein